MADISKQFRHSTWYYRADPNGGQAASMTATTATVATTASALAVASAAPGRTGASGRAPEQIVRDLLTARGQGREPMPLKFAADSDQYVLDEWERLPAPEDFTEMPAATGRLLAAVLKKEKILIHGDYDVDGICATVVLLRFLRRCRADVDYYIPERLTDGYGLTQSGVDLAVSGHYDLVVTVDCGIRSFEEAETLTTAGIDLIITDHHEPLIEHGRIVLPRASAVLNPKIPESGYPFKDLAGVSVALKFCAALGPIFGHKDAWEEGEILAALGTLADSMPLVGENRLIVRRALPRLATLAEEDGGYPGLAALLATVIPHPDDRAGLSATDLAYKLIPLLNAAGRLGSCEDAVRLLLADTAAAAQPYIAALQAGNVERRAIQDYVFFAALRMLGENPELAGEPLLILAGEDWHPGVLGIVAARLMEVFTRPVLLLAAEDNLLRGSGRAPDGFNLLEILERCGEHLATFGGHAAACGLSVLPENLPALRTALRTILRDRRPAEPRQMIDLVLTPEEINPATAEAISELEPFGKGWEEPKYCTFNLPITACRVIGSGGEHLELTLATGGGRTERAVMFQAAGKASLIENLLQKQGTAYADCVFKFRAASWQGKPKLDIVVEELALRPSADFSLVHYLPEEWRGEQISALELGYIWRLCEQSLSAGVAIVDLGELSMAVAERWQRLPGANLLHGCLKLFQQAGILIQYRESVSVPRLTPESGWRRVAELLPPELAWRHVARPVILVRPSVRGERRRLSELEEYAALFAPDGD
ncbi:MAG: single-stranded-DNA-specific exonuclease RecJ [Clostridiaceae bacterium]|nr:single-stranded-DNA-specific exonuclease RecJ [Clostridiaceae bacterium]